MQDKFSWEETRAFNFGLFTLLIFGGLFFFMAFSKHDYKNSEQQTYEIKASFGRTDGLLVGDKVRMSGVTVGRVAGAKLGANFNAVLSLEINEGVKIPDDSSASIVSSGLMGNKYIEIEAGGSEDYIPAGGEFEYTQDAMVLEELLDRIVAMGKTKQNKSEQAELTQFEENIEDE